MKHPIKEACDLVDAGNPDLIALIQQGQPLPHKYRFNRMLVPVNVG